MRRAPTSPSKTNPLGLSGRLPTFSAFQSLSLHHCCRPHLSSCTRVSPHPLKTGPISTSNFLILDKREKTGLSEGTAFELSSGWWQPVLCGPCPYQGWPSSPQWYSAQTTVTSGQDPCDSHPSQPGPCFHPFC